MTEGRAVVGDGDERGLARPPPDQVRQPGPKREHYRGTSLIRNRQPVGPVPERESSFLTTYWSEST